MTLDYKIYDLSDFRLQRGAKLKELLAS